MFRKTLTAGLVLAAIAFPAHALGPEATALRDDILRRMTWLADQSTDDLTIAPAGAVRVEEEGATIRALLPAISFSGDDQVFTWPAFRLNLTRRDADLREVTIDLPETPTVTDRAGRPLVDIAIGERRLRGLYRLSTRNFDEADFALSDISVTPPTSAGGARIGRLAFVGAAKAGADGQWSGDYGLHADRIAVTDPSDGARTLIGAIRYDVTFAGRLAELVTRLGATGALDDPSFFDPADKDETTQRRMIGVIAEVPRFFAGIGAALSIADLSHIGAGPAPFAASLGSARIAINLDGKDGVADLALALSANAADLPATALGLPPAVAPTAVEAVLDLKEVAAGALWDRFFREWSIALGRQEAGADDEERFAGAADDAAALLRPALDELLAMRPPILALRRLTLATPAARLEATGEARSAPASPHQVAGGMTIKVAGLDKLIEQVSAMGPDYTARRATPMLMLARGIARPVTRADGTVEHEIEIALAPDGKVTINGVAADALLGGADRPAPAAGPKSPPRR